MYDVMQSLRLADVYNVEIRYTYSYMNYKPLSVTQQIKENSLKTEHNVNSSCRCIEHVSPDISLLYQPQFL